VTQIKDTISDRRKSPAVWLSVAVDDIRMSSDAFRIYFHIVRRVGKNEKAWPSYRSMGTHCFPELKEDSARIKAIKAVKELITLNLIEVEKNQTATGFHSNNYYLTDDSEWKIPSSPTLPPSSPTLPPPSSPTLPPSSPTLPISDLQYKDFKVIKDSQEKIPPTPQGESEWGGIPNETVLVSNEDHGQEGTEDLTPHQSPEQDPPVKNHLPTPEIKHPAAVEFDSRFLPTDTTADNMNTWNAIIKTGAMRGERSPDPEFLEYYRVLLSKCTHYRGKDCNSNHAKSSLAQKWKSEPLKILADAESWLKAKAKFSGGKSTQTRNIDELSKDERLAILRAKREQKLGA
jgi:hypothetical protein